MKRVACAALLVFTACATSPLGRRQLVLFPDAEMRAMGVASFDKLRSEMRATSDERAIRRVRCVADAITAQVDAPEASGGSWEVVVFEDESANAFALPGGKIGVHTGLLRVAANPDQLATVIGHEVAHVLANHSNERVSQAYAAQTGMSLAQAIAGAETPLQQQLLGLLGVGAQVGILLPYSRAHESEADLLGLDLMARAGFDPEESVSLWRNMAQAGGGSPPELLSTHPSNETRIRNLEARIPAAAKLRDAARQAGRRPAC